MEFKNLKRNVNGSIDGDWIQEDDSVKRYTLDPAMGHIEKAESGEWGDIEEPTSDEKTAHELQQRKDEVLRQITELDLPLHTITRAIAGDSTAINKVQEAEVQKQVLRDQLGELS